MDIAFILLFIFSTPSVVINFAFLHDKKTTLSGTYAGSYSNSNNSNGGNA